MDIPVLGKVILYTDIVLFGIICIILLVWQINVLRGRSMKNPDGSVDDWHEQQIYYGIALADIFIAIPITLAGIALILAGRSIGYYLTGLASFWFLWVNVVCTATSLRFEKPKITINWIIVFPFGAIIGLVYLIWSLVYFKEIF